jgi:hypothetical protein
METKDLHKLIKWHVKLKEGIAEIEGKAKEECAPLKEKLNKIQAKLQTVVHKDNDEGLAKVSLPDGSHTAYARYEDKYKVKDRDHLIEDYILEGVSQEVAELLRPRLNIFGNTIVKDHCVDHRLDTDAVEENKRLVGGELPPGVGMHTVKDVRITKGSK